MAPEIEQLLRRWYVGQLLILFVAGLVQLFVTNNGFFFPAGGMVLLVWGLFAWWPVVGKSAGFAESGLLVRRTGPDCRGLGLFAGDVCSGRICGHASN